MEEAWDSGQKGGAAARWKEQPHLHPRPLRCGGLRVAVTTPNGPSLSCQPPVWLPLVQPPPAPKPHGNRARPLSLCPHPSSQRESFPYQGKKRHRKPGKLEKALFKFLN